MDQLDKNTLLELARLWGELSEIGHNNLEESFQHLRKELGRILCSDHVWMVVHTRNGQEHDASPRPPQSLRTVFHRTFGDDVGFRTKVARDWMTSNPNVFDDVLIKESAREFGRRRVFNQVVEAPREVWKRSLVRDLLGEMKMASRIFGIQPVGAGVEITVGFDRPRGAKHFSERDRHALALTLEQLGPLARSFVQRRGFLPGQRHLTPRERDVLEYLLGPYVEKEIAAELDLSTSWLHEIVISIYRKLGVHSRAELMSLWL